MKLCYRSNQIDLAKLSEFQIYKAVGKKSVTVHDCGLFKETDSCLKMFFVGKSYVGNINYIQLYDGMHHVSVSNQHFRLQLESDQHLVTELRCGGRFGEKK